MYLMENYFSRRILSVFRGRILHFQKFYPNLVGYHILVKNGANVDSEFFIMRHRIKLLIFDQVFLFLVSFFSVLGGLVTILFIIAYIVTKKVSQHKGPTFKVGDFLCFSKSNFVRNIDPTLRSPSIPSYNSLSPQSC